MKHIDVAHLWLQDEVKSNRLRVRRVKSEDNLADIGTKALSNKIIRKFMRHPWGTLMLKGLPWVGVANQSKQIRAVQISRKRHWNQLVAMPDSSSSGSEGSQVSPRETKRGNSKPDASPSSWSVSTQADCHGQLQFFTRRFLDELVCGQHKVLGR